MSNVSENETNLNVEVSNDVPAEASKQPTATAPERSKNVETEANGKTQNARANVIADANLTSAERMSKGAAQGALQSAMHRKSILTGTVASALVKEGIAFAGVVLDRYPDALVYIPYDEFYRENVMRSAAELQFLGNGRSEEEIMLGRQVGILRHAVGAAIPFVITNMASEMNDDGTTFCVAVASRRAALAMIEKRNFEVNNAGQRRINEGDLITGRIVSVGRYGFRANFGGVDTEVKVSQATNRYVSNMTDIFSPGQEINAVIREIQQNENNHIVLTVDCRAAERMQNINKIGMAPAGSIVTGTITSSAPDRMNPGRSTLFAYIDTLGLPCSIRRLDPSTLGHDVRNGDRAVIVITGSTQDGFLRGEIKRFLPSQPQTGALR